MEIERKFLLKDIDKEFLQTMTNKKITQAYIQTGQNEIRIRKKGDKFYLTKKFGVDMVRKEIETEISELEYESLMKSHVGNIISKTRYTTPLNDGLVAEIDIYDGELNGLAIVEVEFKTVEQANSFQIPIWFGKEITCDKQYKNQNLALN